MDRDRETGGDEEGAEGNKIKRTPQVSEGSFFCCFFFLNRQVKRPEGGNKWREESKRCRKKEHTVEKIEHREGDNKDF